MAVSVDQIDYILLCQTRGASFGLREGGPPGAQRRA